MSGFSGGGGSAALSSLTNSLGSNVALGSINTYGNGPAVAQGTSGTWYASGTITYTNSSAEEVDVKLWDGTTVIASAASNCIAGGRVTISVSGRIPNPAGNIRIDVKSLTTATGVIEFNRSGNSKDSTITAIRIA